jgi:hypothetical protein
LINPTIWKQDFEYRPGTKIYLLTVTGSPKRLRQLFAGTRIQEKGMRLFRISALMVGAAMVFASAATITLPLELGATAAAAKQGGNGNGGGHGNGGGNGSGGSSGKSDGGGNGNGGGSGAGGNGSGGSSGRDDGGTSANAGGGSRGNSSAAHDKGSEVADKGETGEDEVAENDLEENESVAAIGSSHASGTARAHAAPNSRVGQLAAYERYLAEGNIEAAAASLQAAARRPVTLATIQATNVNLGLVMDNAAAMQLLDIFNQPPAE